MKVSPAGRALIERNEGCVLHAYPDPATGGEPWTACFGCTGPNIRPGMTFTQDECDQMLSDRLANEFEPKVTASIGSAATTQSQFDAMVSLAYNIGTGGFAGSSVCRHHVAGDHAAAADAFLLWDQAAGRVLPALTRRRSEERALYLSGAQALPAPANPGSQPAPAPTAAVAIPSAREMQTALAALGFDPGPIDGIWGNLSQAALAAYLRQRA